VIVAETKQNAFKLSLIQDFKTILSSFATIPQKGPEPTSHYEYDGVQSAWSCRNTCCLFDGFDLICFCKVLLQDPPSYLSCRRLALDYCLGIFYFDDPLQRSDLTLQICNIVLTALSALDLRYGTGHHTWTVDPSTFPAHFKVNFATGIFYHLALPFTKLSICCLYQRVVEEERVQKILIRVLAACLILAAIGFLSYQINQCVPISAFWNDPFGPQCAREHTRTPDFLYAIAVWNAFTDFCIIAIMLPVIWNLKLQFKSKMALYIVICMGAFSMTASIVRIAILARTISSPDPYWAVANMDIWSCVECNTALICAAAPCIRPFVVKMRTILSLGYSRRMSTTLNNSYEATTDHSGYGYSTTVVTEEQMKDLCHHTTSPLSQARTEVTIVTSHC
jgi:hypothetical protein